MTLAYLASPFSKHPRGLGVAFKDAARIAGRLLSAGVNIYSPIAHCYPLAKHGGIDPYELSIWYPHCELMAGRCDVLIVAHLASWQESVGIQFETEIFERAGKPIFDLEPRTLKMTSRSQMMTFAQVECAAEMRRAQA
jgi:hypothetical protein